MSSTVTKKINRNAFSLPDDYTLRTHRKALNSSGMRKNEEVTKLIKYIDDNIIGKNSTFQGPFGRRKVVFCDYVASGRSLQFIEDYIQKEVLPSYGNTHASTNITSLQSSLFREEARDIIRQSVNASDDDFVIFAGHGSIGVIHKLLSVLGFVNGESEAPIVFAGSCDHHTNLLPWREIGAQIVKINETREGHLDLNDLENQLQMHYHDGKTLIGCFSAVSNITGIEMDTVATTLMLHQYGALSIWDYATAAPYTKIDMNPEFPEINYPTVGKDAIFFSGHKLIGGVQTPGVLIAKKALFKNSISNCDFHAHNSPDQYIAATELREEGATAAVVESIRAALAIQLKETVGSTTILTRAEKISKNMLAHLRTIPEILLLGNGCQIQKRVPIFSFMVRHPRGTFLHHNFVCAILNDVFGIQARAGCACAGPFAQDLLGIDNQLAAEYEQLCDGLRHTPKQSHLEVLRPGFTRVSLPYCMSESEVTFVMEAIKMVATEGWKLLPQYTLKADEWRHHTNMMCKDRKWLGSVRYTDGKMVMTERRISGPGTFPQTYSDCLQTARNIFNRARKMAQKQPVSERCLILDSETEKLRWFMLPCEAQDLLLGNSQNVKHDVPFHPTSYLNSRHSFTEMPKRATPYGSPRHLSLPVNDSHPNVQFAVGQVVTSPVYQKLESYSRNRCYSLGSETPTLPPITSYTSHNELNITPPNSITQSNSGSGSDCSIVGKSRTENLQAYLKEVTKELATEIKSEIRGVISKVEDVLENTDSIDLSLPFFERNNSSSDESRGNSVSANDVAEYLMGVSKEMASEVKSEIREMVNSVHTRPLSIESDSPISTGAIPKSKVKATEVTDCINTVICSSMLNKSFSSSKLNEEDQKSNNVAWATINSVSSQDSGINLSFQESDLQNGEQVRSSSESSTCRRLRKQNGVFSNPRQFYLQKPIYSDIQEANLSDFIHFESYTGKKTWSTPPKNIWKPFMETVQEYDLFRDGDSVLVCIAGGISSLSLLHTMLQYQYYAKSKSVKFSLGAITLLNGTTKSSDTLTDYIKQLGIPYYCETSTQPPENTEIDFGSPETLDYLSFIAKKWSYNIVTLGHNLDDLAENILGSVVGQNKLQQMLPKEEIRHHGLHVTRPLIYVREHALHQFVESRNIPMVSHIKTPNKMKSLLQEQEQVHPNFVSNLKLAFQPLLSMKSTE